jgi:hypothetical protein
VNNRIANPNAPDNDAFDEDRKAQSRAYHKILEKHCVELELLASLSTVRKILARLIRLMA